MAGENTNYIIECENLVKIYKTSEIEVVALQGLDLTVQKGEMVAIIGNSGSGKSTLLNMLGGLDKPSAGKLFVDGRDLFKFNEKQMMEYKKNTVGFVWQNNARNLIPYLTACDNVELVMNKGNNKSKKARAMEFLEMVGMKHRSKNRLAELSGGEQQRVAIAIALANTPKILLADEPTGSVDTKTSSQILDLFRELNKSLGLTIVIVTHDRQISRKVERVIAIRDGRTSGELIRKKTYAEELVEIASGAAPSEETHEELAVIDKSGRLQIPRECLQAIGITGSSRVKVQVEGGKIILNPPVNER